MRTVPDLSAGRCRDADPDLFHPLRDTVADKADGLAICGSCPIADTCRTWAHNSGIRWQSTIVGGEYWTDGQVESPASTRSRRPTVVSTAEAADITGLSIPGVRNAIAAKRLHATRDADGRLWLDPVEVSTYQPYKRRAAA